MFFIFIQNVLEDYDDIIVVTVGSQGRNSIRNGHNWQLLDWLKTQVRHQFAFNPLSPNGDQDQFSPNDIHTLSRDCLLYTSDAADE